MTEKDFWKVLNKSGFYGKQGDFGFILNALSMFCDFEAELHKDTCLCRYYKNIGDNIYHELQARGFYNKEDNTNA